MIRFEHIKQKLGLRQFDMWLLLGATLMIFAGAMSYAKLTRRSGLLVNSLPICADNQFLVYQSSGLACAQVSGGGAIPDCKGKPLTAKRSGDVSTLSCQ